MTAGGGTPPQDAAGAPGAGEGWEAAIVALAAWLDELETALAEDGWGAIAAWAPPPAPEEPPTAAQLERLAALHARGEQLRRRLDAAMQETAAELQGAERRRRAAAKYLRA